MYLSGSLFILILRMWWRRNMNTDYPEEIQQLVNIFAPYLVECHLENPTKEAEEALEKFKEWVWKQD